LGGWRSETTPQKIELLAMNSHEIEQNVKRIIENFSKEDFLYDLLLAYGISKTSITRLKSGDFNFSKVEG
jgi:hypothetical protein